MSRQPNNGGRECCPWCAGSGRVSTQIVKGEWARITCEHCAGTGLAPHCGESLETLVAKVEKGEVL